MSERKNIERLFQEEFKNFEATPPAHVWEKIDASLTAKQGRKKVIPLWWKFAGAAAVLAIALLTANLWNSDSPQMSPSVTDKDPIELHPTSPTVVDSDQSSTPSKESQVNTPTVVPSKQVDRGETPKAEALATTQETGKEKQVQPTNTDTNKGLVQNQPSVTKESPNNTKAPTQNHKEDAYEEQALVQTDDRPSILEASQEALAEENPTSNRPKNRWSLRLNITPVYYNTLSQGSPISQQFSENSKKGDVSISFGVNIAYQISKRLSVRSGINAVNMGYATDGIEFGPAISSTRRQQLNVKFDRPNSIASPNLALSDGKTPLYSQDNELQSRSEYTYQGSINQKFGYLEVPMELKYRLVDKKIGVNIIGGFSSLFLTDNKIIISSNNNLRSEVGEASNLNDMSFSTNIGLGVDYRFTESIRFNLEPMFKYQLGTFSEDDGGFSPYMLGVYTGLSFSF